MARKPKSSASAPPAPLEQFPVTASAVSAIASPNAPFIFFDEVPNFGAYGGVVHLTLHVIRFHPVGGFDRVPVAHLRTSMAGLAQLRQAVEKLELMVKPAPGELKN